MQLGAQNLHQAVATFPTVGLGHAGDHSAVFVLPSRERANHLSLRREKVRFGRELREPRRRVREDQQPLRKRILPEACNGGVGVTWLSSIVDNLAV